MMNNMENVCHISTCETRLKSYQKQINKLNAEIASLEDDLKERDDFLQTVVKGRNDLKKELRALKEKNASLTKENDEFVSKIRQIETKSETDLKKTRAESKECKDKLKLIEEEFEIDYDLAASIRNTGDKLRKEVNEKKKRASKFGKEKAYLSDKLIRFLQEEIGQLKNNLSLETTENKKIKEENEVINKKIVDLEDEILDKDKAL